MGDTETVARRAESSGAVSWLARLGLVSRGVVWLVIALLAAQIALGSNKRADKNGALATIKDKPFGTLLLVVLVIGFLGYAAWRLLDGTVGHRDEQEDRKRWTKRAGSLFRGVVYLFLAASTAKYVVSSGGHDKTRPLTARVMAHTGGRSLIFVIGAGFVIGGIAMAVRAFKQKFEDNLKLGEMSPNLRTPTKVVGTAGLASRGAVFTLIGVFLVDAAVRFDAKKAKGLDATLKTVGHQPYGRVLLLLAALGLLAFAVWSWIEARYRKL